MIKVYEQKNESLKNICSNKNNSVLNLFKESFKGDLMIFLIIRIILLMQKCF